MSTSQTNTASGATTDFVISSAYLPRQHQPYQQQQGTMMAQDYAIGTIAPALTLDPVRGVYLKEATPMALTDLVTHSRADAATFTDRYGSLQTAAADQLRTDHHLFRDGMFQRAGLRVDQAGENLFETSEDFTPTEWQKHNCSIASTQVTAPDGLGTATEMTFNSTSGVRLSYPRVADQSGALTMSVFLKKGTSDSAFLLFTGWTGSTGMVWFDLNAGTVGTQLNSIESAQIEAVGDGWFRCSATMDVNLSGSPVSGSADVWGANSDGSTSCNNGETIFVWGAQLEMSRTATSYIKTTGSPVTRAADVLTIPDANLPSPDKGVTFVVEGYIDRIQNSAGVEASMLFWGGGSNDRLWLYLASNGGTKDGKPILVVDNAAGRKDAEGLNLAQDGLAIPFKIAATTNGTRSQVVVNGVAGTAEIHSDFLPDLTGDDVTRFLEDMNGTLSRLRIFDVALPAAKLIAETTL